MDTDNRDELNNALMTIFEGCDEDKNGEIDVREFVDSYVNVLANLRSNNLE